MPEGYPLSFMRLLLWFLKNQCIPIQSECIQYYLKKEKLNKYTLIAIELIMLKKEIKSGYNPNQMQYLELLVN